MFLEEYHDPCAKRLFHTPPTLVRLSHSFDDPSWTFQYHMHKQESELVYIEKGKGTYVINTHTYELRAGDILIVEQGAIHSLSSDHEQPLSCWTCAIADFKLLDHEEAGFLLDGDVCPHMSAGIHEPTIQALFKELDQQRFSPSKSAMSIRHLLGTALCALYVDCFRLHPVKERQKASSFARDILIYINENYDKPITLQSLALQFHISKDYISHEFAKIYGISPINYVIDRRLSEAKWMLINTGDSLVSIAQKVGYENTNHFSHLFLKRTGYAPLLFRQKFQKKAM